MGSCTGKKSLGVNGWWIKMDFSGCKNRIAGSCGRSCWLAHGNPRFKGNPPIVPRCFDLFVGQLAEGFLVKLGLWSIFIWKTLPSSHHARTTLVPEVLGEAPSM